MLHLIDSDEFYLCSNKFVLEQNKGYEREVYHAR